MSCSFDPAGSAGAADGAAVADGAATDALPDQPDGQIPTGNWWDPAFTRRVPLLFSNGARAESLAGFPALIVLTPARVDYADIAADGADLRFVDSDESPLAFEIERWNEAGTSTVWVCVPSIDALSNDDFIWMYYGNAGASDAQNRNGVWNSDFVGVWHLAENPGPGGAGDIIDSTVGDHHGTATVSLQDDDQVPGRVGGAIRFEANGEYIDTGTSGQFTLPVYTWSMWLEGTNVPTIGSNRQPIWNGDVGFNFSWDHSGSAFVQAAAHRSAGQWYSLAIASSLSADTWYHIASSYDGTDLRIYLNGDFEDSSTIPAPEAPNGPFSIGGPISGGQSFFGIVDEVRVSKVVRSGDWLDAEHASMSDALVSFGPVESL